jgi:cytochrome c biogenesis protein CcmG/thiol:disulfide interchange protein DsbE
MDAEKPCFLQSRAAEAQVPEQKKGGHRTSSRKRRVIIFLAVSLVNGALLALLGSQLLVPASRPANTASLPDASSSPLQGHPAPDFTLAVLSAHAGSTLRLASLKGRPVVLNFWASWCDPCKQEAPLLEATWQRMQGQGMILLGVNFEDTQHAALGFVQHYGITYPNVVDAKGDVAIDYGVTGVPETFFVDRHGVIVHKVIGELSEQTLQRNLQELVRHA